MVKMHKSQVINFQQQQQMNSQKPKNYIRYKSEYEMRVIKMDL